MRGMSKKFLPQVFLKVLEAQMRDALKKHGFHRTKAAKEVGVCLPTFRKYMRKFNIHP